MTSYLVGVSQKILPNTKKYSYWCTFKKNNTLPNDKLLIYVKSTGIKQLYQVVSIDGPTEGEINCLYRGMTTIRTKLLAIFSRTCYKRGA